MKPSSVPGSDMKVKWSAFPTLCDRKTHYHWSKCTHGGWSCPMCFAYGKMLGQDLRGTPAFEPKDEWYLTFGFSQCHFRKNGLMWLVKFAWNKDFESHQCL